MDTQARISAGINFLKKLQQESGGFIAFASTDSLNFTQSVQHNCNFISSLIGISLKNIDGSESIHRGIARHLKSEASDSMTWNYWVRSSSESRQQPLPDDLDDTACALMALEVGAHEGAGGADWARFAKNIISNEVAVGGPYRTWITSEVEGPWYDIDLVVNSNIASSLLLQGVKLPSLQEYADAAIAKNELVSPYYCGIAFTLYSLSRWYRGAQLNVLQDRIKAELQKHNSLSSMENALLISAASNLKITSPACRSTIRTIISDQSSDGGWEASGLLPLKYEGKEEYIGSRSLTTAFCLEALHLNADRKSKSRNLAPASILHYTSDYAKGLNGDLAEMLTDAMDRLLQRKTADEITQLPNLVSNATGISLSDKLASHLSLASSFGWLAYTLYDDIWDADSDARWLGVANVSLRHSRENYRLAHPGDVAFQIEVDNAFNSIDAANTWEFIHANIKSNTELRTVVVPDYQDYSQLAMRSWGHAMTALGVVNEGPLVLRAKLEAFFKHYLIARQLNDDAHDWEEDLCKHRITAVVAMLLRDLQNDKDIKPTAEELRKLFWINTIDQISDLIRNQCSLAQAALATLSVENLPNPELLSELLSPLVRSANVAVKERNRTLEFIQTYESST